VDAPYFAAESITECWLKAAAYLQVRKGKSTNLCLCLAPGARIETPLASLLDEFTSANLSQRSTVREVAESIFPRSLHRNAVGESAKQSRDFLYQNIGDALPLQRRFHKPDTYISRMTHWPGRDKPINQLERIIERLIKLNQSGIKTLNEFEIPITDPDGTDPDQHVPDILLYDPRRSWHQKFPCLSCISLSLSRGNLSLTALYRNHFYTSRAYGNLIGLRDLQLFICEESGYEPGELLCVSSHADLYESFGRQDVDRLLEKCISASPSEASRASA
jgi:thymidylate synthase